MRNVASTSGALPCLGIVRLEGLAHDVRIFLLFIFLFCLSGSLLKVLASCAIFARALMALVALLFVDDTPLKAPFLDVVELAYRCTRFCCVQRVPGGSVQGTQSEWCSCSSGFGSKECVGTFYLIALLAEGARVLVAFGFPWRSSATPWRASACDNARHRGQCVSTQGHHEGATLAPHVLQWQGAKARLLCRRGCAWQR